MSPRIRTILANSRSDRAGAARSRRAVAAHWMRAGIVVGFSLDILSTQACQTRRTSPRPMPPPTHIEMTVTGVHPAGQGKAVLLIDEARRVVVPIYIGGTEALSIELRLEKQRYQRPLTHDLLDSVMHELRGELVKVQVDELRDNIFIGKVFVRDGGRVAEIDARPSDAIALAIGNNVPIFVARNVVSATGIARQAFVSSEDEDSMPVAPATSADPLSL